MNDLDKTHYCDRLRVNVQIEDLDRSEKWFKHMHTRACAHKYMNTGGAVELRAEIKICDLDINNCPYSLRFS